MPLSVERTRISIERSRIEHANAKTQDGAAPTGLPSDDELHAVIAEAVPGALGLSLLRGFKLDLSANPGFRKVFFSAHCDCGTAALLSVEVARDKTMADVKQVLPSLVSKLEHQTLAFSEMSCDLHERMRLGPAAGRKTD